MLNDNNGNNRDNHHNGNGQHTNAPSLPMSVGTSIAPFDDDDLRFVGTDTAAEGASRRELRRGETAPVADDVPGSDVLELDDGDAQATPDVKGRQQTKKSFFKRLLVAFAAIFGIVLILTVAAYFVFFRSGAHGGLTFHRKKAATTPAREEPGRVAVSAEEIEREMAKANPSPNAEAGEPPVTAEPPAFQSAPPAVAETYTSLGGDPITSRFPNESFSSTVNSAPERSPRAGQTQPEADVANRASADAGDAAPPRRDPGGSRNSTNYGANTERSIRAGSLQNINNEPSDGKRFDATRRSGADPARIASDSGSAGDRSPESSPTAVLPPLGTMIPVRTMGTIYTLRADTLVRMQTTRAIEGNGWSLRRGTELYGVLRGSDTEVGRAYISLIGFVDPKTNALVRVSGNLLGGDGTDGVRGRKHRLNSRWSQVLRTASAGALEAFGTLAAALGRRPILISDVYGTANQRTVSPLLQELNRSAAGKGSAGFVEVPAGTPGYVLVLTRPRTVQGVDARAAVPDAINLEDLSGDDLARLAPSPEAVSTNALSDAELSELLTVGTPQQIRTAMPRMSPAMRRICERVLAQDGN